jgi:two-component system OmpR family sensor kinase
VGRLFWKFFFFIWLGQMTTIAGVSALLVRHHNENLKQGVNFPQISFVIESAAATLKSGGPDALRNLLQSNGNIPLYVIDEAGHDLLDRSISSGEITQARELLNSDSVPSTVKQVQVSGNTYLMFLSMTSGGAHTIFSQTPPRRLLPWFWIFAATIASLIFAALSAWYFSKPIRHLRSAFDSVASGKLDVNLNSIMGGRRDDLADLGRDFDRMTGQLRALIDGQRRLLHDISHELRSPLARLQVAIGLVRQSPEKIESSMVRIERESTRMDQLVGELLTLSKLDAGVAASMKETIDPDELLADIADDAQFEAWGQGKEVLLLGEKANAFIQGSTELLHRAIENVIRNAVKYTADGSCVIVEMGKYTDQLKIAIRDSGPGVAESELELIFEPFFRSSSPGNNADGHGLGLAIARRVLEAHGGHIRASNLAAGGLCVEMWIPLAAAK